MSTGKIRNLKLSLLVTVTCTCEANFSVALLIGGADTKVGEVVLFINTTIMVICKSHVDTD